MARWRMKAKHYINVAATKHGQAVEYRHEEVTNEGVVLRKVYAVPMYLDPEVPADQNYPGEIIVSDAPSRVHPKDYVMFGPPTVDMEPLDEEADAISAEVLANVKLGIDTIDVDDTLGNRLLNELLEQMRAIRATSGPMSVVPAGSVPVEDFVRLQHQVAELTAKLAGESPPAQDEPELALDEPQAPPPEILVGGKTVHVGGIRRA